MNVFLSSTAFAFSCLEKKMFPYRRFTLVRKPENGTFFPLVGHRGEVEDTRLEAKDTKKIRGQGQGQPFRGQTLSRPRTGMLEAKAKDQGHKAQVLSKKKKGLHKNFSSDHCKTFSKKFFKRSTKF